MIHIHLQCISIYIYTYIIHKIYTEPPRIWRFSDSQAAGFSETFGELVVCRVFFSKR